MTFEGGQAYFNQKSSRSEHGPHPSFGRPLETELDPLPKRESLPGERLGEHILKNARGLLAFLKRPTTARDFLSRDGIASRTHQKLEKALAAGAFRAEDVETAIQHEYADIAWMLDIQLGEMSANPHAKEAFLRSRLEEYVKGFAGGAPHSVEEFFDFAPIEELIALLQNFKQEDFSFSDELGAKSVEDRPDISLRNVADATSHYRRMQVFLQPLQHPEMVARGDMRGRFSTAQDVLRDASEDLDFILTEVSGKRITGLRAQLAAGHAKEMKEAKTFPDGGTERRRVLKEERAAWEEKLGQLRKLRQTITAMRMRISGHLRTVRTVTRVLDRFDTVTSLQTLPQDILSAIAEKRKNVDAAFAREDGRGIRITEQPGIEKNKEKYLEKLAAAEDFWREVRTELGAPTIH